MRPSGDATDAVGGDHTSRLLVLSAADTIDEGDKIRAVFERFSGFHRLEEELKWIIEVDEKQEWSKHWIMSMVPGRTHTMFMHAIYKGAQQQKTDMLTIINNGSIILTLVLSATLPLLMEPPGIIFEDITELDARGLGWMPFVYNYSLALSVGMNMAGIILGFYVNIMVLMTVRDADWLRMQFECGDALVVMMLCFFYFTIFIAVIPPVVTIWAATPVSIDNSWGRGTLALLIIPSLVAPLIILGLMDRVGTLHLYWFRAGTRKGDPPDTDCFVENFKAKIAYAKKLYKNDDNLRKLRQHSSQETSTNTMSGKRAQEQLTSGLLYVNPSIVMSNTPHSNKAVIPTMHSGLYMSSRPTSW